VRDKVRNEEIRERTEVENIEEHLRELCLRWFGHMEMMDRERPQSVAMNFKIDCLKKGRSKKRWKELIDVDMKVRGLKRSDERFGDLAAETGLPLHVETSNWAPGK